MKPYILTGDCLWAAAHCRPWSCGICPYASGAAAESNQIPLHFGADGMRTGANKSDALIVLWLLPA